LFVLFCVLARAQTPEDAAGALARSIAAHLAPNEAAHVTSRNLSSLSQPVVAKSQAAVERALRKRVRNPVTVEVMLTFSENPQGYLMIAEIRRENDRVVEMASFRVEPSPVPARTGIAIGKKLIWEQDAPILDITIVGNELLILDTAGIGRYTRREGKWARTDWFEMATAVRDPRGRLEISGANLTASIPGATCRGAWDPQLTVTCESGGMFTAGRNTIESPDWAPLYSQAQLGDDFLLAETDGRTRIYDAGRKPAASFRDWGSDFVKPAGGCAGVLAAGPGDRASADFVALYDVVNRAPVRISDPAEFAGPVVALWPGLAIIRNLSTRRYEAHTLTMDCGR
jgi:hypothetical protein